jgi:hypothetical protein
MTHANPVDGMPLRQDEVPSSDGAAPNGGIAAAEFADAKLGRFDHVAIEIAAFDDAVQSLVASGALRVIRIGTMRRTGRRIAMLGDGTGVKIEIIESDDAATPRLAHIAFRSADVAESLRHLEPGGWQVLFGPHALEAAHAETAMLQNNHQLNLQVIRYEDTSPDIVEWSGEQPKGR